jgi:hypothetical protein
LISKALQKSQGERGQLELVREQQGRPLAQPLAQRAVALQAQQESQQVQGRSERSALGGPLEQLEPLGRSALGGPLEQLEPLGRSALGGPLEQLEPQAHSE